MCVVAGAEQHRGAPELVTAGVAVCCRVCGFVALGFMASGFECVIAGGEQHRGAPELVTAEVAVCCRVYGIVALGSMASGFTCVIAGGEQHRGAPELGRPGGAVPPARHTAAGGHSVQPGRRSLLR